MKDRRNLIIGILLGGLLGWTMGFFRFPYVQKNPSFFNGFMFSLALIAIILLIALLWKKKLSFPNLLKLKKTPDGKNAQARFSNISTGLLIFICFSLFSLLHLYFFSQHKKFYQSQLKAQIDKIEANSAMLESNRKASSIALINNLIEKIEYEIKIRPNDILDEEIIARIVLLNATFQPTLYLDEDSLSSQKLSFERGQLLLMLASLNLDSSSFHQIKQQVSFLGADLRGADLRNINLSGIDLREANFQEADLSDANLSQARLNKTFWRESKLKNVNLSKADLQNANFDWANLLEADLREANLNGASMNSAILSQANLEKAKITWANLNGAFLNQANLTAAELVGSNFIGANLRGAILRDALPRVSDFSKANLREARLENVNFISSTLDQIDLTNATITGAELGGISLKKANLSGTDLTRSNLRNANLSETILQNAIMKEAVLNNTNLTKVNLEGTDLENVIVDLENWLEKLIKWQVVGLQSIQKNYKLIPEKSGQYNFQLIKSKD